jgi:hypothetical protein
MKAVEALTRLRAAGFDQQQAEAIVSTLDTSGDYIGRDELAHLATRADVAEIKATLTDTKSELIKWMVGLTLSTYAVSLTLFLVLLSRIRP